MIEDFSLYARAVEMTTSSQTQDRQSSYRPPETHTLPSNTKYQNDRGLRLRIEATIGNDSRTKQNRGDILLLVHGYKLDQKSVIQHHRQLKSDLASAGWRGYLASLNWPNADIATDYIEDLHDTEQIAPLRKYGAEQ